LFLQESYKAFEDAGYSSNALSNKKCGVYLGISANEYALLLSKNRMLGGAPVTSNHPAIAAARIAYYLNLKGPAISVDTACSSSLVAIHLACQGLLSREIDMALAGGVTLWLTPESYLSMSQAGMLSAVGQCKAFDDTADGIVVGDGVGALVLKRLKDAEADNDFIYGVILGSGVNQDGKTNGITAPSTGSQIELEREIYTKHKIDPETISYVETHGTGTRLGDPIELEALATVFKEKTTKKQYCALGSVKSNIGHTISAAGVAGVQKAVLAMLHRTLVPSLHVTTENSNFDFKNSPFYVVREKQAWDVAPGARRRAAVSSFGFSGTNAHLVMEEYPPMTAAKPAAAQNTRAIILLSDGESQPEGVLDVTPKLQQEHVPVIAIGVGTAEGGPVPADTSEAPEPWHRDHIGRVVNSRLEEGVLIRLARETGGAYLRWRAGQGLGPLVERIRQVEAHTLDAGTAGLQQADRFQWPLGAGVLLLVIEMVIGAIPVPRTAQAPRRGVQATGYRSSSAATATLGALLLVVSLTMLGCTAATLEARRGERHYAGDRWREAFESFQRAIDAGAGGANAHTIATATRVVLRILAVIVISPVLE